MYLASLNSDKTGLGLSAARELAQSGEWCDAKPINENKNTVFLGILKIVVWDDVSLASVEKKDTLLGTTNHP